MMNMCFELVELDGTVSLIDVCFKQACLFGWAGRNKEEVMAHAKELAEHGVRGPAHTPEHFIMTPNVMTQDEAITVVGNRTCGEIEYFFFVHDNEIYVGVGSEHTDRALEQINIIKSKAICQKPMSKQVWRYQDIKRHWDEIQLVSWQINEEGEEVPYQNDTLKALLSLDDLMEEAGKLYDDLEGVIMWSGTISALNGLVYGSHFRCEMNDKVLGRSMRLGYDIHIVPEEVDYSEME